MQVTLRRTSTMETKMKISFTPIVLGLAIMLPVHADLVSDSEQILNDAQTVYRDLFPSNQTTQTFDPYRYRFYPSTGIYLGINQNDAGVYLLGGVFGDTPKYVDQTDKVIALLKAQINGSDTSNSKSDICDTSNISDGFTYRREGNTTYISTNGQCIAVPENRNSCETLPETDANQQPVETGIHALSQSSVTDFEITGLNLPGFDANNIQDRIDQKTCSIHAPRELTNQTIHSDICLDITSQLGALGDIAGVTPPVTNRFKSTVSFTKVDDCFKTDAAIITNLVTNEIWTNQNGNFVKAN